MIKSIKAYENVSTAVKSVATLADRVGAGAKGGAAPTAITAASETLRSVAAVTSALTNTAGISANLGFSKSKSTTATQESAVVGSTIAGGSVNVTGRAANLADPNRPTLISDLVAAQEARTGRAFPNGNMATAHAEIGAIQQAFDAGRTAGQDMVLSVRGLDVCSYCQRDIVAAADRAGLNSLTITAFDPKTNITTTYSWVRGQRKLKVK